MNAYPHPSEWHAKHLGGGLLILVAWVACVSHLAVEWRYNPEYRYGWIMPFAVLLLLGLRFRQLSWEPLPGRPVVSWGHLLVLLGVLLVWLPVRLIGYANLDWHLMSWATFGLAFALTVVILHAIGGRRAVMHYASPFLVIAGAVPLPYMMEYHLIDALKQLNTSVTLEALHLGGLAAERVGRDLIMLRHVILGIEDGCTGIRSLHLCLAAALFWGELHRLPLVRRIAYLCLAVVMAVLMNSIRSVALAILADRGGSLLFDQHHEMVGMVAQVVTLCLALCAVLVWGERFASRSGFPSFTLPMPQMRLVQLHGWLFGGLAIALLFMEGARVMWFNGGSAETSADQWTFQPPSAGTEFRSVPFPRRWASQMGADHTYSTEWSGPDGDHRIAHYVQWKSDNPAALTARGHQPEICLAGAGLELKAAPVLRRFHVGGVEYTFRRYQFSRQDAEVVVYFGVWSGNGRKEALHDDSTIFRSERLMRAWRREGNQGRRLIEVGLWGVSPEVAEQEMAAFIRRTMLPVDYKSKPKSTYASR